MSWVIIKYEEVGKILIAIYGHTVVNVPGFFLLKKKWSDMYIILACV
jgi:hypothetical protein